ncbi:MAG TPA: rhodanese-like domain-containing protein [Methylomirabilota bacterium]
MRGALTVVAAVALLVASAAPAAPPEYPVNFIKVDELKGILDGGTKADIIDVRHWEQFVESHIKGARSMPLRVVNDRASEISKTGLVVFY